MHKSAESHESTELLKHYFRINSRLRGNNKLVNEQAACQSQMLTIRRSQR